MSMTVLKVSQNYYVKGGSDSYFFALSELLKSRGCEVVPFAAVDKRNLVSEWSGYFPLGADFESPGLADLLKYVYSVDAKEKLRRLLSVKRFDVAHMHIYYGKITSSILSVLREAGVPTVQTLHEYKLACPVYSFTRDGKICEDCKGGHFWKATLNRCNRNSLSRSALSTVEAYVSSYLGNIDKVDRFIAVSNFIARKMVEHGVPQEKISVVHNFVDSTKFEPATSPGDYFLYFGRIEWLKGVKTMIDAFAINSEIPLYIVGDGNAKVEVERYVQDNCIDNVKLLGFRSGRDLHELIRGSVATLLPAEWYENCPMSVLESLALARPVIGTRIGGIPELITDGEDGLIVDVASVEQLANAVRALWGDRIGAALMGIKGRRKVVEAFNADEHLSKILKIYKSL